MLKLESPIPETSWFPEIQVLVLLQDIFGPDIVFYVLSSQLATCYQRLVVLFKEESGISQFIPPKLRPASLFTSRWTLASNIALIIVSQSRRRLRFNSHLILTRSWCTIDFHRSIFLFASKYSSSDMVGGTPRICVPYAFADDLC